MHRFSFADLIQIIIHPPFSISRHDSIRKCVYLDVFFSSSRRYEILISPRTHSLIQLIPDIDRGKNVSLLYRQLVSEKFFLFAKIAKKQQRRQKEVHHLNFTLFMR